MVVSQYYQKLKVLKIAFGARTLKFYRKVNTQPNVSILNTSFRQFAKIIKIMMTYSRESWVHTLHCQSLDEHGAIARAFSTGFQHVLPRKLLHWGPVPQMNVFVSVKPKRAHEPTPVEILCFFCKY